MINIEFLKAESDKINVHLDETALKRYDLFAEMLVEWNSKMNLTAITEPDDVVLKHFIDSITPLSYFNIENGADIIDVGCGAGFPSLPLLIARPDLKVTFFDALEKRLKFIDAVLDELGLNGNLVHGRAEDFGNNADFREQYDYAFTRAVAPLNVLAEYCLPFVKVGGSYISMKGADDEIELGTNAIGELGGEIEQVVSLKLSNRDCRNLISVKKISQTSPKYPRKTKKISSKPL
ncbi:MAG: 16S rRNA (guanine(527)-N(7))-methyltransferase RsmG [Clostridiales bacterium]|nr:16S rRNA (guanine(527)-N(7))-methyltransferase RsmG [Clostridiales bacterium]